jgi:ABC-type phosphate transport system substrate-binding protein
MRKLIKVTVAATVAALASVMAVGPALADPPNGVTPKETDVVGVGSDTLQNVLDQFSLDYNRTHTPPAAQLYSWDALNPKTGAMGDMITTKSGCSTIARPDGSSAGISALDANAKTADGKAFCIDFARSSRPRASTDPALGPGGIVFVALAKDAVTWASNATTNAPANLTTAQLNAIYTCTDTNWSQVGGANAPINAQLPQTSSGTRAFFLKAIGVVTPGSCVNSTAQENEGVDPVLQGPNVIFPYSVGKFIAEVFHSAKCLNSSCTPNASGVTCTPKAGQNAFGCDTHGTMVLRDVNGTVPTSGTGSKTVINSTFDPNYMRTIYDVVRWASTPDHIPAYLEKIFASSTAKVKGWACTNSTAKTDLRNYGFLTTPFCGVGS